MKENLSNLQQGNEPTGWEEGPPTLRRKGGTKEGKPSCRRNIVNIIGGEP